MEAEVRRVIRCEAGSMKRPFGCSATPFCPMARYKNKELSAEVTLGVTIVWWKCDAGETTSGKQQFVIEQI